MSMKHHRPKRSLISILCLAFLLLLAPDREAIAGSSTPVSVTITKVKCIDDCRNEGLEAAGESAADFYAIITVNGDITETVRAEDDAEEVEPFWTAASVVPNNQPTFHITIQIWDHDSTSGDDNGDTSPVPGRNNFDIDVDRVTGKWSGDVTWPKSCSTGDGSDEPTVEVCFAVGVLSPSGDADGDGLLDDWEINGLDANGDGTIDVNLPAMGANPLHKDLFLELDAEINQSPTQSGIKAIKNAFAAAPLSNPDGTFGVNLWVDTGVMLDPFAYEAPLPATCSDGVDNNGDGFTDGNDPTCIGGNGANRRYLDVANEGAPAPNCLDGIDNDGDGNIDGKDNSCLVGDNLGGGNFLTAVGACNLDSAFYNAKATQFSPLRRWVFRYAISAARPGAPTCTGSSGGQGEIGGNDFIEFNHDGGTVMHELGHTLNLRHGGNEDTNCKPNYVSGMNYDNQFGINRVGGGAIIDYSGARIALNGSSRGVAPLNPLIENTLDENGILDASDNVNRFIFSIGAGNIVQTNLNANPNWSNDIDPPLENPVTANIDNGTLPGCANSSTNETLNGFNDWPVVSIPFRQFGDSSSSAINPAQQDDEPTLEELIEHDTALHSTDLVITVVDTPDSVAAGTQLTFTVTATNNGPNPASSVQIIHTLPAEVILTTTPTDCAVAGQVITCNVGELEAGENSVVTIVTDVPPSLVYDNGAPLSITNQAEVKNLSGQETNPVDNIVNETTQVVAVADLSMVTFSLPNPPLEMLVGESVVVELNSTISSDGPSSPMDTAPMLLASATSGASIAPTNLTTSQRHLTTGEVRPIDDYVIIRCDRPGLHTFKINHRIRPLQVADSDPNPANDEQATDFQVSCTGSIEVTINIIPSRYPNTFSSGNRELPIGIMTTTAGEYGRAGFDASRIIQDSVRVGPPAILTDVSIGAFAFGNQGTMTDLAEPIPPETILDNDLDLLMVFDGDESGLTMSDHKACVVGLYEDDNGDKQPFYGCDSIVVQ